MTDETNTETPEIARKKALIAEGAARTPPVKLDMRYSEQRMIDALNGEASKPAVPLATAETKSSAQLDAEASELAELRAARAADDARNILADKAARAVVVDPNYNVRPGTLTSQQTGMTPSPQDDELALAWRKATEFGLAGAIPKGASVDQVMKRITDHLAAKAQEFQILEEQARRKAAEPQQELVQVRILKKGDGKVGKGVHLPGIGNACWRWNDLTILPRDIAQAQEDNGYLEIVGAAASSAAA